MLEAIECPYRSLECVLHRLARQRVIEHTIGQPGHAVHRDGVPDQQHGYPECRAHERQRHRQQERHREDRTKDQEALFADQQQQFAQRDLVPLDRMPRRRQRFGEADFGIAELDGGHDS